jgi:hypothetical protein
MDQANKEQGVRWNAEIIMIQTWHHIRKHAFPWLGKDKSRAITGSTGFMMES